MAQQWKMDSVTCTLNVLHLITVDFR